MKIYRTFLYSFLFITSSFVINAQNKSMIQPPFLKAGDTVAIVAPAGIIKPERADVITEAETLLKSWGLHVWRGKYVLAQNGHFAGTDEQRCEDFQHALNDPSIKAIWCARGGYGSVRIMDKLDYTKFYEKPKWIIGYSDITAFHCQLNTMGYQTLHAMMCTSLEAPENKTEQAIATFKKALFGEKLYYNIPGSDYNIPGTVTAQLTGGNLTLLTNMLGSDTSIDTDGKIILIEEIGEYAYAIDRMLQSLKRGGYFENCKGIIFGDISKIKPNTTYFGKNIYELILDMVKEYKVPVLFDFPAGHEPDNRALYLGRNIKLTITKEAGSIDFL